MISVSRNLCWAAAPLLASLVVGCASPDEGGGRQPQPTSSVPLAAPDQAPQPASQEPPGQDAAAPAGTERAPSSENSLDSEDGLRGLPMAAEIVTLDAQAAAQTGFGELLPSSPPEPGSLIHFVPFEATATVDPADFAHWSEWLRERFLEDPGEARQAQLDELLGQAHVIDLTPAYINLVDGLDMADPDQVSRAGELTSQWFLAQERYKQMVLDENVDDMRPLTVGNRVMALKAWVRWWQRTLHNETVERYRSRVDELTTKLQAMRKERRGEL